MTDIDKCLKKAAHVLKDEYKNDSNLIAFRDIDIMSKSEKRKYIRELKQSLDGWNEMFQDFKCKDHGGTAPFCVRAYFERLKNENKRLRGLLIKAKPYVMCFGLNAKRIELANEIDKLLKG